MKSTLWVKRVVLVDGQPSGKGRPSREVKRTRTCLYIPLKESYGSHTKATAERPYNPSKNDAQRKQFKRTRMSELVAVKVVATAPVAVNAPDTAPVAA
jgi:hypothetical protein